MDTRNINPLWALATVVGMVPVIGAICAVVYHSFSAFFWSLAIAATVAVGLPLFLFLMLTLAQTAATTLACLLLTLREFFERK